MTIAAVTDRRKAVATVLSLGLGLLAGCALPPPAPCATLPEGPTAWVIDQGWQTEIALRAADLSGPLGGSAACFPRPKRWLRLRQAQLALLHGSGRWRCGPGRRRRTALL